MMRLGTFQEALYYRLNVIPLKLPPLRERRGDIPLLADHFLQKFCDVYGSKVSMEEEVYDFLCAYPFPGNVRELENLIHRLISLAPEATIRVGDLPREIFQLASHRVNLTKDPLCEVLHTPPQDLPDLRRRKEQVKTLLAEHEFHLARQAVREADGNLTEAAKRLGVHRVTLHKMLKRGKSTPKM
jgi:DNA-binding NtrC family response regulator